MIKGKRAVDVPELATPATPSSPGRAERSWFLRFGDVVDAVLSIPDQESSWYASAVARGLTASIGRVPDVVYSSAPAWTGQLVAYTLASLLRRPWVADFRDPWGRAPWRGDRFAFAMRAARTLERWVVRRADRVLFVSRGNRDEYAAHYGAALASKFRVVPNGCDVSEFEGLTRTTTPADPFVLLHAGSLYAGRTPLPLFAAIARGIRDGLINRERFRIRFIGAFSLKAPEITTMLRTLQLDDVIEFLPRVPRTESLQAMTDASALLLLQPNHAVAVPAKLYEYLAAGRPILAIASGETATLVEQSGVGVCAEGNDESAILRAVLQVMAMAAGPEVRPAPELFDGARRAEEMVAVIAEVLRRGTTTLGHEERESDAVRLSRWSRI
jgi:glycosyltransferase involved in cell wall biosynthesis